jgi:transcriptional regulator with XRE-family HTH domain
MDTGARLREARERQRKSLRDVARATKISPLTLEALEQNQFGRVPGGIFARAFVRSFAREVGLDPEPLVSQFIAEHPVAAPDCIEDPEMPPPPAIAPHLRRLLIVGAALVGLAAAAAAGAYFWAGLDAAEPGVVQTHRGPR